MNNTSYYAVIPAKVLGDKSLSANAKLLYAEISMRCNQTGFCWAKNKCFEEIFEVDERTIRRWISQLAAANHIYCDIKYSEDKKMMIRHLYLAPPPVVESTPGGAKMPNGGENAPIHGDKNVPTPLATENINNKNINNNINTHTESKTKTPARARGSVCLENPEFVSTLPELETILETTAKKLYARLKDAIAENKITEARIEFVLKKVKLPREKIEALFSHAEKTWLSDAKTHVNADWILDHAEEVLKLDPRPPLKNGTEKGKNVTFGDALRRELAKIKS
ncbi:MAG: helix-turn-helix domain-containing protein [Clostridiales bacterium]|jgi:hypothetical protein|nr:helix-turn-helix domain-containing protein [Clostridiales bacterium]